MERRHTAVGVGRAVIGQTAVGTLVITVGFKAGQVALNAEVKPSHIAALHACNELRHTVKRRRDSVGGVGQVLQGLPFLRAQAGAENAIGPIQPGITGQQPLHAAVVDHGKIFPVVVVTHAVEIHIQAQGAACQGWVDQAGVLEHQTPAPISAQHVLFHVIHPGFAAKRSRR